MKEEGIVLIQILNHAAAGRLSKDCVLEQAISFAVNIPPVMPIEAAALILVKCHVLTAS